ncbi:MAG: aminotransferase class I/II-fold pyridoxal phosphate-dependent enzyme, partial [Nitrospira sp.]|nr:aminotransferase class I/II-fold pyridoxal phosphate-dependent enzyme [Nitrospira sp.]
MRETHGGDIYGVSRELGCRPTDIADFSANINPLGPSPAVWKAIIKARRFVNHYPDPLCRDLRELLGQQWRVDPDQIVVGNGSMELIDAIPRAFNLRRLLIIRPTFSEYERAMARAGGSVTAISAKGAEEYAVPVDRLCRLIDSLERKALVLDGLVLCNPNNPTGQACSSDEVGRVIKLAAQRGLWVVIDEAFVDYCPERSVLPWAVSWPRVLILRSLTKFYALPGLRVGYAVADHAVARR